MVVLHYNWLNIFTKFHMKKYNLLVMVLMLFVITLPVNSQKKIQKSRKNPGAAFIGKPKHTVIGGGGPSSSTYSGKRDPTIEQAKKQAQGGDYIGGNFKVTKPVWGLLNLYNGSQQSSIVTENKLSTTLEQMSFGSDGNTVLLTIYGEEDGQVVNQTYCWSGSSVKVTPNYDNQGVGHLAIVRGNQRVCGDFMVFLDSNKWIAMIDTGSNRYTVSTFRKGMTRSEVENYIKQEFGLSQFKFTRNSGNLKVYSFYWLDQQKVYNFFRTDYHFELRNDKKFADFYFDAQGKLVKWFFFM